MTDEIVTKKGDNLPIRELELQEEDSNGDRVPIDLTGSSVEFFVYDNQTDQLLIDEGSVTITDAANGLIEYEWQDGDTQETGVHKGEFVITYADGELTVPNEGFIPVKITEDLQDNYS